MKTGPKCAVAARTSALVAASSAGEITTKPTSEQASAVSSTLICEGRPADGDAAVRAHHLTFIFG